jgi:cyclopentanol dehydrogenase
VNDTHAEPMFRPGALDGAVALITGGAGTIGAATARRFAREGAKVVVTDVRGEAAAAIATELDGLALEHDVASDGSWAAALAATLERFNRLTVLVNNAGLGDASGVIDQSLELWDRLVAVNQTGVMLGIRHAAPAMRTAGGGSIINVSSIHGLVARPGGPSSAAAYTATKGAVRLLTKAAASELAGDRIRVNSVHPGYIDVPMRGSDLTPERERARALTPMGRFARPEEIAAGITFLASDESSFVTGSELVIDGGYTAV